MDPILFCASAGLVVSLCTFVSGSSLYRLMWKMANREFAKKMDEVRLNRFDTATSIQCVRLCFTFINMHMIISLVMCPSCQSYSYKMTLNLEIY